MHATDFVDQLQGLARKMLPARAGTYPQPIIRSAKSWAAIYPIEPPPQQAVQDPIADLLTRYYISPTLIGNFTFVSPDLGLRRLRFLVYKSPRQKAINLYVETFENQVYQAPNTWDTQTSINQTSGDFLDCLGSYAYHLSHCTLSNLSVAAQLRSLESEFLMRISAIAGSAWWRENIIKPR